MNSDDRERIAHWVEQHLDDSLTEDEFAGLQQMLIDQPESRELYLDLMQQHAHLRLEQRHLASTGLLSIPVEDEFSRTPVPSRRIARWLPTLIAFAASLLLFAWWGFSAEKTNHIAQIIDSSGARWGDCSLPTTIGSELDSGRLKLERGLTTIRFESGAEVTLEAPAELEIQSPMRGRLLSGTAVVEVPESAHGFTLSTSTVDAIDHGTAFSVTVDHSSQTSSIEVIEGEVEVQHVGSGSSRRLKQRQRVVASAKGLGESVASSGEAALSGLPHLQRGGIDLRRITTAEGRGRDATVSGSKSNDVVEHSRDDLVLIKNPYARYERFARKGYFAFDLDSAQGRTIQTAEFSLTLLPSGLGFASKVDDCEFTVYGLVDESKDDWSIDQLQWQNAPANLNGPAEIDTTSAIKLGSFVVPRGIQHGQVSIEGNKLVDFVASDTNGIVTLIVVRKTKERDADGLVHGFASRSNLLAAPPSLVLGTSPKIP